jgi:dienelactone hydrolase
MNERALYLETPSGPVFALLTEPSDPRGSAVLIVPPFGWDAVASYRPRRAWAESLAGAGHLAMRIDLPGSGDSAGEPTDDDLLAAWVGAVGAAARWLRSEAGAETMAVIGIGLGGLLALLATDSGAPIDDLVLWATPARGRRLVREIEAFARMEDEPLGDMRDTEPLEPGAIEAGGYLLSPETAAALSEVDAATLGLSGPPGRRALLLDRDGVAQDSRLEARLTACDFVVGLAPGEGYGEMVAVPHEAAPPEAVFQRVNLWLAARAVDGQAITVPDAPAVATFAGGITETPVTIETEGVRLFGILAEPAGAPADATAVFLNAGAIRHSGPNRMWTDASRRLAERGIPAFRLDIEGIGDASGEDARDTDVSLYVPSFLSQIRAALDALEQRGRPGRFVLAGLCSGSFWAFHQALEDPRVTKAVLLNPRLLLWDPNLVELRETRELMQAVRGTAWRRVFRGDWNAREVAQRVRSLAHAARTGVRTARVGLVDPELALRHMTAAQAAFVLAFSGDEPLHDELEEAGLLERMGALPNVEIVGLPGHDHTLRPLAAQRAGHEVIAQAFGAEAEG